MLEIPIKDVADLVVVDVINVNPLDERVGLVSGHARDLALRRATTVSIKRDPH